ncbi:MAG: hypothetical protein RQ833_11670 [Sphingomonadaceae bacterium]|nr:hypothetical protein [Sphingomonadaceae bacterium]
MSRYITVEKHIDLWDELDNLSDNELRQYLAARSRKDLRRGCRSTLPEQSLADDLDTIEWHLLRGELNAALAIVTRLRALPTAISSLDRAAAAGQISFGGRA